MRTIVARFESRSGKHWVEVYQDKWGWGYQSPEAFGFFGPIGEAEAIAQIAARVDDFQPDSNKAPMGRVA